MSVPVQNTAMTAQGLALATSMFRNQPNFKGILTALLSGCQPLANAMWQVITYRILSNLVTMVAANQNTGTQIDVIGGLVGEARGGRTDAQYLPAVSVKIRVNRSKGGAEDVIQVASLLSSSSTYAEFPKMHFIVEMWGLLSTAVGVSQLLGATKAIGSYGVMHYSTTWPSSQNLIPTSRHGAGTLTPTGPTSRRGAGNLTNIGLPVASSVLPS